MPVICPSERAPIQNTTAYLLTKAEFSSIFGGGNDTVIEDFFFFGGGTSKVIPVPSGFCFLELGEYEDISNLEILLSLLSIGGVVTTAIALLLPYLKILRNIERFLQSSRVCDCQKETFYDPAPEPPDPLDPDPNPPPDTCCKECFEIARANVRESNEQGAANYLITDNANPTYERLRGNGAPVQTDYERLNCLDSDLACFTSLYIEGSGTWVNTIAPFDTLQQPQGGPSIWITPRRLYYKDFCEIDPKEDPAPNPPEPLPVDNFSFCEEFPTLCNACPDTGNAQDVVVSGKISATCSLKEDISFNIKF